MAAGGAFGPIDCAREFAGKQIDYSLILQTALPVAALKPSAGAGKRVVQDGLIMAVF